MPAKKVDLEKHILDYNTLLAYIDGQIALTESVGPEVLEHIRTCLVGMKKDVPRLKKHCQKSYTRVSGLLIPSRIDQKLATFLKVRPDTLLSRNEVRNAINVYIKYDIHETRPEITRWAYLNPNGDRNLQNKTNRSVIDPDSTLVDLLDYGQYVDRVRNGLEKRKRKDKETGIVSWVPVTDETLTYCVVQKLYQKHLFKPDGQV